MKLSYDLAIDPPPAMDWEGYEAKVLTAWNNLLSSEESRIERNVQNFLEHHPCLIHGPFGLLGSSGHAPFPAAVISQPNLFGSFQRTPDFMWIAKNSVAVYPVLVEIEAPQKRWFTNDGRQHSDFTQAHGQLAEWRTWLNDPVNVLHFARFYKMPSDFQPLKPIFVLICGREAEANATQQRKKLRMNMSRQDEIIMTYDRLKPDPKTRDFLCVRVDQEGYRAISAPATMHLGPGFASLRSNIACKKEAIRNSLYFTQERREFLEGRLDYWDSWAKCEGPKIINNADRE
jgi:hypothetical protein